MLRFFEGHGHLQSKYLSFGCRYENIGQVVKSSAVLRMFTGKA